MKRDEFVSHYARLPSDKRRSARRLLREKGIDFASLPIVARPADIAHPPLSFAQQRMWLLDRLEPGSPRYNVASAVRLQGPLDSAALAQAFNEIVRRHEVLRTRFESIDGEPCQVIDERLSIPLPCTDLGMLPPAQALEEARRIAHGEAQRPFDLGTGPLIRVSLVRIAERDHLLLTTLHHAVCDGWSIGVLIRELTALYRAHAQGQPSPLPELALQYADYAHWQQAWLEADVLQRQLAYWQQRLAGAPPLLELPTDRPRPPVQSYRGASVGFTLTPATSAGLRRLAERHDATLFMTLAAAFNVMLWRLSGQGDLCVGTPVAGRQRAEIEPLIGLFVNTLVLRTQLTGDERFTDVLAQVRDHALAAYEHQDLPFEQLLDRLAPQRSLSHSPLFQVMFSLDTVTPPLEVEGSGLTLAALPADTASAKFDLSLDMSDQGDALAGAFEYSTDLFERATIERFAGQLQTLCEAVAADPAARIDGLPLLGEREREQLAAWNRSEHDFALDEGYPALFARRAAAHPQREAARCGGESLTYQALDERSSRIAQALVAQGAAADTVVVLLAERGLPLLAMMIGVLKAGAAFLSLDVNHPRERLREIVRSSRSPLVLASRPLAAVLDDITAGLPARPATVLAEDVWLRGEAAQPVRGGAPGSLAYVIYTSGSTGKPKGAMVEQRGMLNNMLGKVPTLGLGERDRIAQTASPAFDISVWQFLAAPLVGACVHILPDAIAHDPVRLAAAVDDEQLTLLEIVPSLMRSLLDQCPAERQLHSLRWVMPTGEALPPALVRDWFARFPGVPLMNLYGPAECSDDVACHPMRAALADGAPVPIGRPTPNNRLFVLDARLQPVPIGVPGEICVAGTGVGRGYLHDDELTRSVFISHPLAGDSRLYRTGDIGRQRADGTLEYLGRFDHQLKIRGHRIEPGEIENRLLQHPAVAAAAVLAQPDAQGQPQLVAYWAAAEGARSHAVELRALLAQQLPQYMLPAGFVQLDALPLNANGKLDRAALPAATIVSATAEHVPPRTPTEEIVAAIWAQVLHLDQVSASADFFELGGHSLLGTQVISRIRSALGVELPLLALFDAGTVAELAQRVDAARADAHGIGAPPIVPVERSRPLPLSFAQQRLWFLDRLAPGNPFYNAPSPTRLRGPLDVAALERALNEVVRRHEVLRTTFGSVDGTPVQVVAPELVLTLGVTDLGALPAAQREAEAVRLAREDAERPFDLQAGPMLRAALLRLADDDHVLLLTFHHVVNDAWSDHLLAQELSALYNAYARGEPSPLPELAVQYADFAQWQRRWLQGEVLASHIGYWKRQLAGIPKLLELPTDFPRPAVQTYRGATIGFALPSQTAQGLRELARRANATLFMTLAAAFSVLLARYSRQADICIGTPIANRNRAETDRLIGFFVNSLVLRTRLHGNPGVRELLEQMRTTALDAYAHQDAPFELLVDELNPERSLGHSPLFQVVFMLQNAPPAQAADTGLGLEPFAFESSVSQFDLTLDMIDSGGELAGSFEFNTDLFSRDTIQRLIGHFQTLCAAFAADPAGGVLDLPLLTPEEQRQILVDWNQTAADLPAHRTVHEWFEAQVEKTPQATAVVFEGQRMSYAELNALANRLAHHLRHLGVGPDVLVGLCVERGLDMVVGLIGILKAGGAYVPLDPEYPAERLAAMLDDARPPVLLTQAHLLDALPAQDTHVFCLDRDWPLLDHRADGNPPNLTLPEHLFYVIYTSGSTGRPKGSALHVRGFLNLLAWYVGRFGLGAADRCLILSSYNFDLTQKNFFAMLATGGELHLSAEGYDPRHAASLIREQGITFVNCISGAFYPLLSHSPRSLAQSLRHAFIGGELVNTALLDEAFAGVSPLPLLHNTYGPTEATDVVSAYSWRPGAGPQHIPIGRPIDNVQILVLDASLNLVPVGVPGELHIGGIGLARGYLRRPDLTAERFVPNPYGPGGTRLYKTGDLVRLQPDGNIMFLCRLDHQVKIRGFRIELGDVEAALARLPQVLEAVVVAREDEPGEKRLVAYIVPDGPPPSAAQWRSALLESLPDYMVPAHFVLQERLPRTPNGKLDVAALPPPDMARGEDGFIAPRSDTERALAAIWADTLGMDRLGVNDDFFTLGGDSILAIQIVSRIQSLMAIELPLRTLFEAPTVAELAERLDALQPAAPGDIEAPIAPVGRDRPLPLSFAQQRLWMLEQIEPGNPFYNLAHAVRLTGRFELAVFERTLNEIVRRHEVLRTTFATVDGAAVQVIAPSLAVPVPVRDLRALPREQREAEALRLTQADALAPFDFAAGPLLRALLIRMDEGEHVLQVTLHHIVSDAWSNRLLVQEINAIYNAFLRGQPSPLPELAIQYADFACWQRQWMQGGVLQQQLGYWKQQLAGAPALLQLPTDRPRPPVQSGRGDRLVFTLAHTTFLGLQSLAKRTNSTLFMVLAAAFNVLLHRHGGQDDICIGSPMAGRQRAQTEPLIGFFVNTWVLRTRLHGNPRFADLVHQVRENTLAAHAHQDLPFEHLVDELAPERSLSHSPIFQVAFMLQNIPIGGIESDGLAMQPFGEDATTAKIDLKLDMTEVDRKLFGALTYNTDLFDRASIERMLGHFETLCEAAIADPDARIATLPMLTELERQQLLVHWNPAERPFARELAMHERFEAHARRTPDAVALRCGDIALSYAQLNQRANRLAHGLRRLGVGPDTVVGLCAERSPELIAGMLAILKAGGAYLPLDPHYPQERLDYMLQDASPAFVLTQSRWRERLAAGAAQTLCLDGDSGWHEHQSSSDPVWGHDPQQLAYVIYTSGSTGRAKGVMLRHEGLSNLAYIQDHRLPPASCERVLQLASFNFDGGTFEIFWALAAGGTLFLAAHDQLLGAALVDTLHEQRITGFFLPPSALAVLPPDPLPDVHAMLSAGEACTQALVARWARDRAFFNGYGPTENTVCATLHRCDADGPGLPPIGEPAPNVQLHVLDAFLQPVPVGVTAELYIGGPGLARGYLNRPGLTAERFIPHPFAQRPGERLYRTGDLVRRLADGQLQYVGRVDDQVKLRGFRIEPGEVEAALAALPAVSEAAVAVVGGESGRLLAAYVVLRDGAGASAEALRAELARTLPDYMVPAHVIVVDEMPRTPNGKVDRRALPAPGQASSQPAAASAASTPTQQALAAIWAAVLQRDAVGIEDDFFELGGDSILAIQVMSQILSQCDVELPLRAIFESPTIAALAERVDAAAHDAARGTAIGPADRAGPLPVSFAQQRLWFLDQLRPGDALYNLPLAVRLRGRLDVAALARALNEMARRHEALRTSFRLVDHAPVQVIAPQMEIALPLTDLGALPPVEREAAMLRMAQEEAARPFRLDTGPLIRAALIRVADDEHVVLLTMHHAVSDGWSMTILLKEVTALYAAFVQGLPSPLPPLALQYADFSQWQRRWLSGEVLQRQIDHWKQHLAGAPALLQLPTDRPRPSEQTHRGASLDFRLPHALAQGLHAVSRQAGATLFMTLAAVFNVLLARHCRQTDICIGTPIANRNRPETEPLIGFFVNTLVLRTRLAGNPGFDELLAQVRENALGAFAHQDIPFEQLVDELSPERSLSHSPLFQVMFSLQNVPAGAVDLPGLAIEPVQTHERIAKFDLTLAMTESGDGILGSFDYSTDLFDRSTIERMAGHFLTLCEAVVAEPRSRIADLPLLTLPERREFAHWNASAAAAPLPTFPAAFERQVRLTPDRVAVVFEGRHLTYTQLNDRANRLAHHLRSLGAGPDARIALCLERSLEMMVAMLAVLKAGAAYVPLDPAAPPQRLAYMLQDARPQALLTQARLRERLDAFAGPVLALDADWPVIERSSGYDLVHTAQPEHLAYVIYTSGTTGKPKGTAITHRSLSNFAASHIEGIYRRHGLSALQAGYNAPYVFDASVSVFILLLDGHTLHIVPEALRFSPEGLLGFFAEHRLDMFNCVPAQLKVVVDAGPMASLPRLVVFGSDAIDAALWQRLQGADHPIFYHAYGPTECTVDVVTCHVQAAPSRPVIGKPEAGSQVFILDERLHPVPVGVAGELHVGGQSLARGYLDRPGLTAERFIPNPLGAPGSRMYRTGDLARYLADGHIEYLGRTDHQVKIRGFRVELAEIDAALARVPGVREAAVVAREDAAGSKRLVAYVAAQPHAPLDAAALRAGLQPVLPDYMIPAHFVMLERLPLTPNGKLDRQALPAPDLSRREGEHAAPATRTEQVLAAVWTEVLGVSEVGRGDHFFRIGGDSIQAIQVISRARGHGLHFTPRQLFQHPTLAELAAVAQTSTAMHAEQGPVSAIAPLTPIQSWLLEQDQPAAHHYNQALFLSVMQPLDIAALQRAVHAVIGHHDALRLCFSQVDGQWQQSHAEAAPADVLQVFDLADVPRPQQIAAMEERCTELQAGFDPARGPLLRVAYFRLGGGTGRLLLAAHHLVVDGVSWRVLLEDLQAAYRQPEDALALPPKTSSFTQWATRLAAHAASQALDGERDFWRAAVATPMRLPVDDPSGSRAFACSASHELRLGAEDTALLLGKVPAAYNTRIDDVLLTALAMALSDWLQVPEVTIDLEGHGREDLFDDIDLSRTVGWFTSLYPVRLAPGSSRDCAGALKRVKEQLRAVPNKGIGFGLLRHLRRDPALADAPTPPVSFNYLGQVDQVLGEASLFGPAPEPHGPSHAPENRLAHEIELNAIVADGQLGFSWSYSRERLHASTVEALAQGCLAHLQALIRHCVDGPGGRTPSDFPLAGLDQAQLDKLLGRLQATQGA